MIGNIQFSAFVRTRVKFYVKWIGLYSSKYFKNCDTLFADADAKRVARISILKELQKKPKHDSKILDYLKELEA